MKATTVLRFCLVPSGPGIPSKDSVPHPILWYHETYDHESIKIKYLNAYVYHM